MTANFKSAIGFTLVLFWFSSIPANSQVTKEQLFSLLQQGIQTPLIVSLIENNCVDFDVDAGTLIELNGKVPAEIIQAALECKKGDKGQPKDSRASLPPSSAENIVCTIYKELTSHPGLRDFPVTVSSVDNGYVTIVGVRDMAWAQERAGGTTYDMFEYIKIHRERSDLAAATVRRVAGVKDVVFKIFTDLNESDVALKQKAEMRSACAKKGRLSVETTPQGAEISIGDEIQGETPWSGDAEVGRHVVKISLETYSTHEEQVAISEGETVTLNVTLTRLGEINIVTRPEGASVLVDKKFVGHAPLSVFRSQGAYEIAASLTRHIPRKEMVSIGLGEKKEISMELTEIPKSDYCFQLTLDGFLDENFKAIKAGLENQQLFVTIPLYQVVTSALERRIDATHVWNGDIVYEPRYGRDYVSRPEDLIGRPLGGLSVGETAASIVTTQPSKVRISDLSKKDNTIRVLLIYLDGQENSVFFDFERSVKSVSVEDFFEQFCMVFTKHDSFALLNE